MKLIYTKRAKEDLDLTFAWYENQRRSLGFEFLDNIESSIKGILTFPEMYPLCYSDFRRCVIRRFPFSIFYKIENEVIVIYSIFDNRQDPQNRP